jgi:hypothetical protein
MLMMLSPDCNGTALADQLDVPVAVPAAPRLFDHVTAATPTLSLAVPLRVSVFAFVAYVAAVVGLAIATVGDSVSGAGPGGDVSPPIGVFMSLCTAVALSARL